MILFLYVVVSFALGALSNHRTNGWIAGVVVGMVGAGVALNALLNNRGYLGAQRYRLGAFLIEALFHYGLASLVVFGIAFVSGRYLWRWFRGRNA